MTVRQVIHIRKTVQQLRRFERADSIADQMVATPGFDERAFKKHIAALQG